MSAVELGDVAEFINGAAFKPADWGEDGARIIRIQNLNDPTKPFNRTLRQVPSKYHVPKGTLLVSWSASLGVFEWNEPDTALLNQHIFKVVPDDRKVRQDYLRLMLAKALKDMEKHAHGSTMLHVNRGEFLATKIPLPPLDEQKRIAAILDQADELRRKRQCAIDRLNQLGQAIFHEMFGDLADPDSFASRYGTTALGSVVQIKGGGTPSKANKSFYNGNIPWVSPKDMKSWEIVDALDKITAEAIEKSATNLIPENSVLLVNRSGILKHTLPVGITRRPVAINQDLKALICSSRIRPEFLAHLVD